MGCLPGLAEAHPLSLFGLAEEATAGTCCPIAFQKAAQFQYLQQGRADQGKESGEAVVPPTQEGAAAQEHISPKRHPDLPADGMGVVTGKTDYCGIRHFAGNTRR